MKFEIDWTFYFQANHLQKCNRLIEKLAKTTGAFIYSTHIDPCLEDPTLFRVTAKSTTEAANTHDAPQAIRQLADRIAAAWILRGPSKGTPWEFGGATRASSSRIKGIESAMFIAVPAARVE